MSSCLKSVSGFSASALKSLWSAHGDVGDVAFQAKSTIRTIGLPSPLVVHKLVADLLKISAIKGKGSNTTKSGIVVKMLVAARGEETRFLARQVPSVDAYHVNIN